MSHDKPAELWTPAQRQRANLAAMALAADLRAKPRALTRDEERTLEAYSGWGGLSIKAVADKLPDGFPAPEERGLIHEYYTPSLVCAEVARVVKPLLPGLMDGFNRVLALEPSAGIGRFVRAFEGPGFERILWHAVEYSELSAAMLEALRPKLQVFQGPFEKWVADNEPFLGGHFGLVVSNPPYGKRGASTTEDPNRDYRLKDAYAYFLRRGLDLLAPGGLGVYLIPSGFLTGTSKKHRDLRAEVLRRHHLSAAYRLPSGLFPGAMLVTDLLFFRARGGALAEVDAADESILEGRYFKEHPEHILGKELGAAGDDDDQTAKPRWGYQVVGEFTALPDLVERPMCGACVVVPRTPPKTATRAKSGVDTDEGDSHLALASSLGERVHAYLALVAAQESDPVLVWEELHRALVDWTRSSNKPPSLDVELVKRAKEGSVGMQRFLAAFEPRSSKLIPALRERPVWSPRYQGRPGDVVARAEFLYRQHRSLRREDLGAVDLAPLFQAGWCEDGPGELVPGDVYYTGHLWPKYDRARARGDAGDAQAATQARKLLELIAPAMFDEIDVSLRGGWVPLELVEQWIGETLNFGRTIKLEREGLLQARNGDYEDLDRDGGQGLSSDAVWALGYINHDKTLFSPSKKKTEDIDKVRLAKADEWEKAFRAWCGADEARREQIELAYRRQFQGYRAPSHSSEPLALARWTRTGAKLHPYQASGARRVLANRGGLIAYDVGLGKTFTGCAVVAAARQEGWCKRPVVVVPNSIVWKWKRDFANVLPDYRVAVIGSKRKVIQHGPRKGYATSETDTPAERAAKWTRFMGGEFDVVLCTYSALPRTEMRKSAVIEYASRTASIQREIKLRQRNAHNAGGKLTERQKAILNEGVGAWVAEQMELPEAWEADPGILWDDIGVDLVLVDEAQNFKNLYLPEEREGGVPRFMGNPGEGSKRAWQLDFRLASVRARTGGAGVVLLSATPAKNSPLEFYNLLQYVDHDVFTRMGIRDPESFIDRYCALEMRQVVDAKMEVVERSACVGFKNLHELRDVIFRLGEFKTAQDVGLKLPKPTVNRIEVALDARQEDKYASYVAQIERALTNPGQAAPGEVLGLLARLALVSIHADLDGGYTWKTAGEVRSPHSPKFDALAKKVLESTVCGHIVFCDNVAAHAWIRAVLVEAGIAAERIAVLNAEVAKAAADRQRIAQDFNGDPDEGIEPRYDVVIANAVAYEGIDLQTRTCAIHHLDLPWEPATLEQRNGRGVRQGNKLAVIAINYYFALRSSDGMRYNLIQGKNAWMVELLKSQKRDTNNPGAQTELGPEEILLLISRDPDKTRQKLDALKAKREAEAKQKIADEASGVLRQAVARFTRARSIGDEQDAKRLRLEAEERLADLTRVNAEAWPWAAWAVHARDRGMLVPPSGASPAYDGLRVAIPDAIDSSVVAHTEFGVVREGATIGVRRAGSAVWKAATVKEVAELKIRPEHLASSWPADDDALVAEMMSRLVPRSRSWGERSWNDLGWTHATASFVERQWARFGEALIQEMRSGWAADQIRVPVVAGDKMRVGLAGKFDRALPPTAAGWSEFLALAPASGLNYASLEAAGQFWWGMKVPRNLLSAGREGPRSKAAPSVKPVSVKPTGALKTPAQQASMAKPANSPPSSGERSARSVPAAPKSSVRISRRAERDSPKPEAQESTVDAMQRHVAALEQEAAEMRAEGHEMGPMNRALAEARALLAEEIALAQSAPARSTRTPPSSRRTLSVLRTQAKATPRGRLREAVAKAVTELRAARSALGDYKGPRVEKHGKGRRAIMVRHRALEALETRVERAEDRLLELLAERQGAIALRVAREEAARAGQGDLFTGYRPRPATANDDDLGFGVAEDDDLGFGVTGDDDLGFGVLED